MAHLHPIHQATQNSPYGDLTREEFYKKHQLLHHQSFIFNKQNVKIFTQSWRPSSDSAPRLRGLVAMIHGYTSESSWIFELNAVAIAKAGFFVCALDLQGHGYSDGSRGHIPRIDAVVRDCIKFFDSARADHPKLPAFLYGESLGGAIAMLICLKQRSEWNGLILSGAMCGVSRQLKPVWPLEKLLPVAAFIAQRKCHELEVPMLMVHGGDDKVCDPESARFVYESAASKDKTSRIFKGMWHMLIGEPNDKVELVFGTILISGEHFPSCGIICTWYSYKLLDNRCI